MLTLLLAACTGEPPKDTGEAPLAPFSLEAEAHLPLPFATVGDAPPEAELDITNSGEAGTSAPTLTVDGSFAIEGPEGPFAAGETRRYTIRYTGDTSSPALATGALSLAADGVSLGVTLAAVIGDPELPDARWMDNAWGKEATLALPSAPFPHGDAPYDDASVRIFVPDALVDEAGIGVVTHLHGWGTTLDDFLPAQRLLEQHALSGRDAVLVVPQGPTWADDGDFGKLMEPGGHGALVRDVVAVLYRDGLLTHPVVADAALTAHSGGYRAAAAILDAGDLPISAVHLFDALYGERDTFRAFAEAGGVLRSAWTESGGTDAENLALREELLSAGLPVGTRFDDAALRAATVTIGPVDATHSALLRDDRAYARWLAASGLPHLPAWPPELVSALSDGAETVVTWRPDPGASGLRYRVEGSDNGESWGLLTDTAETTATVPPTPFIRVTISDSRHGNSAPSDVYGGTGAEWLVVDGFDRVLDGSYDLPTHPFAAQVGAALGVPFSVASNEAVATGEVALGNYPRILWLLGDEGTWDRTFSAESMAAIDAYVASGGVFVASGAEVGYATDPDWLLDTLGAAFVADDAGTTDIGTWAVGAAYPEDSPDVLAGEEVLWAWSTGEPAAVVTDGRLVVVGFGLENLDVMDRSAALGELRDALD